MFFWQHQTTGLGKWAFQMLIRTFKAVFVYSAISDVIAQVNSSVWILDSTENFTAKDVFSIVKKFYDITYCVCQWIGGLINP